MGDEIGALGGLVTAGLAADALTPGAGHVGHHTPHCANCGAAVTARFCADCGQSTHIHRSLLHVGEEFLHGLTHFDGKAWQTLPMLLFRPGRLTRDYVYGKRARYVPPVALFLLTVFLMFFAFSFVDGPVSNFGEAPAATRAERVIQAEKARKAAAEARKALADITAERAALTKNPKADAGDELGLVTAQAAAERAVKFSEALRVRADLAVDHPEQVKEVRADWVAEIKQASKMGDFHIDTRGLTNEAQLRHALENPELTLYKLQQKAYKFSFLLIPLSIPWLWLMFAWRREVHLYDHAVFALYSLSFMSLLFIAATLLFQFTAIDPGTIFAVSALIVPVHVFVQMRGAYALGKRAALWRTALLLIGALLTLSLFAALILVLGIAG